jgi:hypothetical protein
LVRKVRFRVLTTNHAEKYNMISSLCGWFVLLAFEDRKEDADCKTGGGVVEEFEVEASSSRLRINER